MINKIYTAIFFLFVFSFLQLYPGKAENIDKVPFGITTGENVNMRDKPDINGKVIYQFLKGEIVLYDTISEHKTRIVNDDYHWYKVKTQYPWKKKCIEREWKKVYINNPTRLEGWVYGKYFKLLDGNLNKEYRILKEIIELRSDAKFDSFTTLNYNPTLQIYPFKNKEYYIYTIQSPDFADDCQKNEYSQIYIMDYEQKNYRALVGRALINTPYEFYDLNNDGYAEIFVFLKNSRGVYIGISVYSEKKDKSVFRFNFNVNLKGDEFWKFHKNSYIELIRNKPDEKMEIIAYWINEQKEVVKKVVYKWNGETFVEEKK